MAIHISPTSTEIETSVKETIHSLLQRYPEHNQGSVLSEVLRHSFQTITIVFGKTLPKELRWCEKLPTIVLLEESIPGEDQLMAEPTTQNDTITTQDKPITERCSTPNDTTHDSASATQDTSNPESLPDNTAQDGASATQDTCSPERNSTSGNASSTPQPLPDDTIPDLMAQAENFEAWTKDPSLFWNYSTQSLKLPEPTFGERCRALCEMAAEEPLEAMIQTASRRYRSIIVYLLFQQSVHSKKTRSNSEKTNSDSEKTNSDSEKTNSDSEKTNSDSEKTNSDSEKKKNQYITVGAVYDFFEWLGIESSVKKKDKYLKLLQYGQRRLEFCYRLSKMKKQFQDFSPDGVNFEDIKYGFLYLTLDDRMWNKKQSRCRNLYNDALRDLNVQELLDAVETSGANLAAKTILQYCQALVQGQPALSNGKDIDCTFTSNRSESENAVQELQAPADESNSTAASKRSSTEAGLDDPTASKRFRQNVDILVEAGTAIANDSNPQIVQLNKASSPNKASSLNNTASPNIEVDQNLADTQEGNLGDMNATSEEPQQQEVADLCTSDWDAEQQAILDTYNWDAEQQAILDTYNWDKFGGYGFSPMFQDLVPETDPSLPNVGSLSIDRTDTL